MSAQLVSTIRNGYLIKTEMETFVVAGVLKIRNSYEYICKTSDGRTIAIDRKDVLEAQRNGSAVVLAAQQALLTMDKQRSQDMTKKHTTMGQITAETLNAPIVREITGYFKASVRNNGTQMSDYEKAKLMDAADSLEEILSWAEPTGQ